MPKEVLASSPESSLRVENFRSPSVNGKHTEIEVTWTGRSKKGYDETREVKVFEVSDATNSRKEKRSRAFTSDKLYGEFTRGFYSGSDEQHPTVVAEVPNDSERLQREEAAAELARSDEAALEVVRQELASQVSNPELVSVPPGAGTEDVKITLPPLPTEAPLPPVSEVQTTEKIAPVSSILPLDNEPPRPTLRSRLASSGQRLLTAIYDIIEPKDKSVPTGSEARPDEPEAPPIEEDDRPSKPFVKSLVTLAKRFTAGVFTANGVEVEEINVAKRVPPVLPRGIPLSPGPETPNTIIGHGITGATGKDFLRIISEDEMELSRKRRSESKELKREANILDGDGSTEIELTNSKGELDSPPPKPKPATEPEVDDIRKPLTRDQADASFSDGASRDAENSPLFKKKEAPKIPEQEHTRGDLEMVHVGMQESSSLVRTRLMDRDSRRETNGEEIIDVESELLSSRTDPLPEGTFNPAFPTRAGEQNLTRPNRNPRQVSSLPETTQAHVDQTTENNPPPPIQETTDQRLLRQYKKEKLKLKLKNKTMNLSEQPITQGTGDATPAAGRPEAAPIASDTQKSPEVDVAAALNAFNQKDKPEMNIAACLTTFNQKNKGIWGRMTEKARAIAGTLYEATGMNRIVGKMQIAYQQMWTDRHEKKSVELKAKLDEMDAKKNAFDIATEEMNRTIAEWSAQGQPGIENLQVKLRDIDNQKRDLLNKRDQIQTEFEERDNKTKMRVNARDRIADKLINSYDEKLAPMEKNLESLHTSRDQMDLIDASTEVRHTEQKARLDAINKKKEKIEETFRNIGMSESEIRKNAAITSLEGMVANGYGQIMKEKEGLAKRRNEINKNIAKADAGANPYRDKREEFVRVKAGRPIEIKVETRKRDDEFTGKEDTKSNTRSEGPDGGETPARYEVRNAAEQPKVNEGDKERIKFATLVTGWNDYLGEIKTTDGSVDITDFTGTMKRMRLSMESGLNFAEFKKVLGSYLKLRKLSLKNFNENADKYYQEKVKPKA